MTAQERYVRGDARLKQTKFFQGPRQESIVATCVQLHEDEVKLCR